ncbi:MAG: hypothetical protein KGL11_09750 [Alphaproteobacteria bacterium]|nr:hypothetical protein [Alphaproteobacteria bacterium]
MHYNVSFFKDVLSSDGHAFKCVQRVIAVDADSPNEAINAAKQQFEHHCSNYSIGDWRLYAEAVECAIKLRPLRRMPKATQHSVTRTEQTEKAS